MAPIETASSRALNLLELILEMSQHLNAADIATAAQVCKSWHASLQPLVFRDVYISYELGNDDTIDYSDRLPPIDILQTYSHCIQTFTVVGRPKNRGDIEYFDLRGCTTLERFIWKSYEPIGNTVTFSQWDSMVNFIQANRSRIRDITVEHSNTMSTRFCEIISQNSFPSLRTLRVRYTGSNESTAPYLWRACHKLDSLEIRDWGFGQYLIQVCNDSNAAAKALQEKLNGELQQEEQDYKYAATIDQSAGFGEQYFPDGNFLFPRMKSFVAPDWTNSEDWLDIMKRCPRLEVLQTGGYLQRIPSIARELCAALSSESLWPNLNSIKFGHDLLSDEDMAEIILSLNRGHSAENSISSSRPKRPLKSLEVISYDIGHATMNALRDHHHLRSLEILSLRSERITSADVLTILTSCPRLNSLTAPRIHAAEIAKPRDSPWVCLDLETWKVDIVVDREDDVSPSPTSMTSTTPRKPTETPKQEACLEQLGRLRKLKVLKMHKNMYTSNYQNNRTISLVLSRGLERLVGLKQLEEVSFGGLHPGGEDRDWMRAHWKSLKKTEHISN